jgi:hypothetical protein
MPCFSAASRIVRLNRKTWSAKLDRVAVAQVDLELGRPFLVDERVDLQALLFGEMIDVVDQFVELVDAGDRIALAAENGAAGASLRRMQRIVRVVVLGDEVELDFRRDDRLPAALMIKVARRSSRRCAGRVGDVVAVEPTMSQMTCAVGSVSQGTTESVERSGTSFRSLSRGS